MPKYLLKNFTFVFPLIGRILCNQAMSMTIIFCFTIIPLSVF